MFYPFYSFIITLRANPYLYQVIRGYYMQIHVHGCVAINTIASTSPVSRLVAFNVAGFSTSNVMSIGIAMIILIHFSASGK